VSNIDHDHEDSRDPLYRDPADGSLADESGGWLWLLADKPGPGMPVDPPFEDPAMTPLTPPGYSRDRAG